MAATASSSPRSRFMASASAVARPGVEDGGGERQPRVEYRGLGEHVDAVHDDQVVPGQQRPQAPVVLLAVGEVEVAQHRDLVERGPRGDLGGDRRDSPGVRVRPCNFDPTPGSESAARWRGQVIAVTSCRRATNRRASSTNGATSPVVPTVAIAIRIGQMAAMLRGAMRGP